MPLNATKNTHSQPVEVEEDVTQTDQVVPSWLLPTHVHVDRDIPCQQKTDIMYKEGIYRSCQQQTHAIIMQVRFDQHIPCRADQCLVLPVVDVLTTAALAANLTYHAEHI